MADTVKIKIEFGEVEVSFEGPAAFARDELQGIVGSMLEKMALLSMQVEDLSGFDDEEDLDEDDDEEEEAAIPEGKGH